MPSDIKELRYFSFDAGNSYHQKANAYRVHSMEAYLKYFSGAAGKTAIGEASPNYLRSPIAASQISCALPHVRLIVSLRNPADRLFSLYQMDLRSGRTQKDFDEEVFGRDAAAIKAGFYYPDLRRYFDRFDAASIKVVLFDELAANPLAITRDLYRFLNVADDFRPDVALQNEGGMPKNTALTFLLRRARASVKLIPHKPAFLRRPWMTVKRRSLKKVSINPGTRLKILEICREDILETQKLIGRDLSGWLP